MSRGTIAMVTIFAQLVKLLKSPRSHTRAEKPTKGIFRWKMSAAAGSTEKWFIVWMFDVKINKFVYQYKAEAPLQSEKSEAEEWQRNHELNHESCYRKKKIMNGKKHKGKVARKWSSSYKRHKFYSFLLSFHFFLYVYIIAPQLWFTLPDVHTEQK